MTLLLLLMPIWVALAWAGLFGALSGRTGGGLGDVLGRWGGFIQLGILATFLAVVRLLDPLPASSVIDSYRWPMTWALLAAFASGPLLYLVELTIAVLLESKTRPGSAHRLMEGGSRGLLRVPRGAVSVLLLVVALPVVEEVLWRRALVTYLIEDWELAATGAVALSGLSFGVNHYWFGLRNVVTKSAVGMVWGWLFLVGGLAAAVVAHVSFQACAWRRLAEVASRSSIGADGAGGSADAPPRPAPDHTRDLGSVR